MKISRTLVSLSTAAAVVATSLLVGPAANAAESPSGTSTTIVTNAQLTNVDQGEAALLGELISAVNREQRVFDKRLLPSDVQNSDAAQDFEKAVLSQGGTVIEANGATRADSRSVVVQAAAGGKVWTDAWGVHFTASSAVIGQLVAAAAGGGGSAAAVAGVMALNLEGFPANLGGAAAAGVVAAALFAASGVLALCNLGGKGSQFNYNWVTWTCWAL